MKSTTNKGFTLIELLVVIAIIGILSGIAIFGLSDARKKGQDAAIVAALGQIPAQAAIFYDDGNTYVNVCDATNVAKAIADAEDVSADSAACFGDADSFAVSIGLVATTTDFCVDSEGFTGNGAAQTGTAVCQ
jgi:prepilin-type N-terminal cleavage/methylation domain-containing protein